MSIAGYDPENVAAEAKGRAKFDAFGVGVDMAATAAHHQTEIQADKYLEFMSKSQQLVLQAKETAQRSREFLLQRMESKGILYQIVEVVSKRYMRQIGVDTLDMNKAENCQKVLEFLTGLFQVNVSFVAFSHSSKLVFKFCQKLDFKFCLFLLAAFGPGNLRGHDLQAVSK